MKQSYHVKKVSYRRREGRSLPLSLEGLLVSETVWAAERGTNGQAPGEGPRALWAWFPPEGQPGSVSRAGL